MLRDGAAGELRAHQCLEPLDLKWLGDAGIAGLGEASLARLNDLDELRQLALKAAQVSGLKDFSI